MRKKEYYLRIAEKIFPGLKAGRFFANVNGREYYYSGLMQKEVKVIYRTFYDEFDFAFSIHYTFSLCDQKTETRWKRQEGSGHFYSTPVLFVVDRSEMNYAPEHVVSRMQRHYRANTLILDSYAYGHYSTLHLSALMNRNGLNFMLEEELEKDLINPHHDFVHGYLQSSK